MCYKIYLNTITSFAKLPKKYIYTIPSSAFWLKTKQITVVKPNSSATCWQFKYFLWMDMNIGLRLCLGRSTGYITHSIFPLHGSTMSDFHFETWETHNNNSLEWEKTLLKSFNRINHFSQLQLVILLQNFITNILLKIKNVLLISNLFSSS